MRGAAAPPTRKPLGKDGVISYLSPYKVSGSKDGPYITLNPEGRLAP